MITNYPEKLQTSAVISHRVSASIEIGIISFPVLTFNRTLKRLDKEAVSSTINHYFTHYDHKAQIHILS